MEKFLQFLLLSLLLAIVAIFVIAKGIKIKYMKEGIKEDTEDNEDTEEDSKDTYGDKARGIVYDEAKNKKIISETESIYGRPKGADEMFCRSCGAVIKKEAEICIKCGVRQIELTSKSRMTAAFLALLLGGVGMHKFYLEKPWQGIIYLLFFWTFIPTIIAFLEGISYLLNTDAEFAAEHCK